MSDEPIASEGLEVFLRSSGADGTGLFTADGLTIRAGSTGRASSVASFAPRDQRLRDELVASGDVVFDGDRLRFVRDCHFGSPSSASSVLIGRPSNGWIVWKTADGQPIDATRVDEDFEQEQEFRRRWYEAHVERLEADSSIPANRWVWQDNFLTAADEGLSILAALDASSDVAAFGTALQQWSVKSTTPGFNGFSGQMLVNQLVKRSENARELADVLSDVLRVPTGRAEARRKIDRLVAHIEEIRVGAHPAPGHVPFLVSYFWALQDHDTWPLIWATAALFTEFCTGQSLPPSPSDRYDRYCDFVASVDDDFERFERVAAWWNEFKPLILDPMLVDRCEFGIDSERISAEALQHNADALVAVAGYTATRLVDVVSAAAGRSLSAVKPPRTWAEDRPRSDYWADWRAVDNGPSIRLWVTHAGAGIGIVPGVVRAGWLGEVTPLIEGSKLADFQRVDTRGSVGDPNRKIVAGRSGEFLYGKWFEPEQLAGLDVEQEITAATVSLQPLLDELIQRATGRDDRDSEDPLTPFVAEFVRDLGYPSASDEQNQADRERFERLLAADSIALADPVELRALWSTGRYGGPGSQSILNISLRDADAAEYDRIIDTLRFVIWGDGDDADRIDAVLDRDGERYVRGLGESVILKLLAICHPDRYVPVFPYAGPEGKLAMLKALDLPVPDGSRGQLQVRSNELLRDRLSRFFPGDPWAVMRFGYWYREHIAEADPSEPDSNDGVDVIGDLADELLVDRSFLDDIIALLEDKKQIILYGPPGTGKTYLAQKLAEALVPDPTRRPLVQFHPSMSYEDFFEGYRPDATADGDLSYRLTKGPLALLAERALKSPGKRHLMVIDEINRANLPRVLGELLFLLEYRNVAVPTLYRPDDPFELPADIWFIGTMNTADRSIALVDAALRRRFHFVPFFPNHGPMAGLLERWLAKHKEPAWVGELVAMVNDQLTEALNGPHLQIGPSYFMKEHLDRDAVRRIWEYNIEPFIEDQFFGDPTQIDRFRFSSVMAAYLSAVDVASLEELEAALAGDAGAATIISTTSTTDPPDDSDEIA
jgi:5-methylcytosine-specific restriction protein B